MPISDPRDRFFYTHHTPMKDTYYHIQLLQVQITVACPQPQFTYRAFTNKPFSLMRQNKTLMKQKQVEATIQSKPTVLKIIGNIERPQKTHYRSFSNMDFFHASLIYFLFT